MHRFMQNRVWLVLGFLLAVGLISAGVWRYAYVQALGSLSRQATSDLALASDRLTGQLQRFREVAVLTADRAEVMAALNGDTGVDMNRLLQEIADKSASLDLVLLDARGQVRASATGDLPEGAINPSVVRRAWQGALGWAHGQWGQNGPRVFQFAAPVFTADSDVRGVLVAVVDLGYVELDWVGSNPAVFFTDQAGRVFFTNRSEITFWERPPGEPGLLPLGGEALPFRSHYVGRHEIWNMGWGPYLPPVALHVTRFIPVVGFTAEVLADVRPAQALARLQAAAVAGLCLAFGALLFLATERRRTLAEANAQLEARVEARTAALSAANKALRREVVERAEAEAALAQAQADLVQAGKLSALGQMSAGISHELNQPLMAIQSFADNGVQFLDRNDAGRARDNLGRIADMAHRMGRIIKNLRAFARQESAPADRVDVGAVLDSAIELTETRIAAAGVALMVSRAPGPIWVRGGEVRLGQVFVNLITNAVDAMDGTPDPRLQIGVDCGETVRVTFEDSGPGIDMPDKVFEPFYSTKTSGDQGGMGLGLSISYGIVQSFGGDIRGRNTGTGAVFTVELEALTEAQEAAE